jgi:ABC-type branched-subunit amino acid transport system ATPase component
MNDPEAKGLLAREVVVRFGGLLALDGVSVAAPPGRITGLIGPNGAGKTTMFNVCCGFERPAHGQVLLDGREITRKGPHRRFSLGLGRTFQRMELFGSLTVRENVELALESLSIADEPLSQLGLRHGGRRARREVKDAAGEVLDMTGLSDMAETPAGQLSTGQGRLVELARALARRPRILLLDEPSSGLDVAESAKFGDLLAEIAGRSGVGILLVEHDMSLVLRICDWIYVLDFGRPLFEGAPAEVRASTTVREAYLGKGAA